MSKSNESFYLRLKEQLDNSTQWPSNYKFKFILKSNSKDQKKLIEIFKNLKTKIYTNHSSTKKFISFTILVELNSSDHVIQIYKLASEIDGIISL